MRSTTRSFLERGWQSASWAFRWGLQMDRNSYYGGAVASITLEDLYEKFDRSLETFFLFQLPWKLQGLERWFGAKVFDGSRQACQASHPHKSDQVFAVQRGQRLLRVLKRQSAQNSQQWVGSFVFNFAFLFPKVQV